MIKLQVKTPRQLPSPAFVPSCLLKPKPRRSAPRNQTYTACPSPSLFSNHSHGKKGDNNVNNSSSGNNSSGDLASFIPNSVSTKSPSRLYPRSRSRSPFSANASPLLRHNNHVTSSVLIRHAATTPTSLGDETRVGASSAGGFSHSPPYLNKPCSPPQGGATSCVSARGGSVSVSVRGASPSPCFDVGKKGLFLQNLVSVPQYTGQNLVVEGVQIKKPHVNISRLKVLPGGNRFTKGQVSSFSSTGSMKRCFSESSLANCCSLISSGTQSSVGVSNQSRRNRGSFLNASKTARQPLYNPNNSQRRVPLTERSKSVTQLKRARSLYHKACAKPWTIPPRPCSTMGERDRCGRKGVRVEKKVSSSRLSGSGSSKMSSRSTVDKWKSAFTDRGSRRSAASTRRTGSSVANQDAPLLLRNGQRFFAPSVLKGSVFKCSYCPLKTMTGLNSEQATLTIDVFERVLRKVTVIPHPLEESTPDESSIEESSLETQLDKDEKSNQDFSVSSEDSEDEEKTILTHTLTATEDMKLVLSDDDVNKSLDDAANGDEVTSSENTSTEVQGTYGLTCLTTIDNKGKNEGTNTSLKLEDSKPEVEGCSGDQPETNLNPIINDSSCKIGLLDLTGINSENISSSVNKDINSLDDVNSLDFKIDLTDEPFKADLIVGSNLDGVEEFSNMRDSNPGVNNSKSSFSFDASSLTDQRSFSFSTGLRGVLKDSARCRNEDPRSIKSVAFRSPIQSAREASYDESMSTLIDGSSGDLRDFTYLSYNNADSGSSFNNPDSSTDNEYDPLDSRTVTPSMDTEAVTCRYKTPSPQKAVKQEVMLRSHQLIPKDLSISADEFSEDNCDANGITFLLTQKKLLPHRFPALSKALKQPYSGRPASNLAENNRSSSSFASINLSNFPSSGYPTISSSHLAAEGRKAMTQRSSEVNSRSKDTSPARLPHLDSGYPFRGDLGVCGRKLVRCTDMTCAISSDPLTPQPPREVSFSPKKRLSR